MTPKIGIDIVENQRLNLKPEFLKKFLTSNELLFLESLPTNERKIEFCAGRWAVKEAIFKVANGEIQIPINLIEIVNDSRGEPKIINPEMAKIAISISHEKHYSVGIALKWGE